MGHVSADAADAPGAPRGKIEEDLGAEARIGADSSRAIGPPFAPDFHAARHKVENLFQRIERVRRIAPVCETTLASVIGVVVLVAARDRFRRMRTGSG